MAMKKMTELKDVFNGISSFMFDTTAITLDTGAITLDPEYELPVTVDTLSISQDDPTINHYKVHGLGTDWVSSSEPGDANIEFTVPTNHTDVLTLAYGSGAVKSVTATVSNATGAVKTATGSYTGKSVTLANSKISGCIALLNDAGDKLLIINNVALYASPVYDNASTEPFALKFSGTIESGSGASMYFLTRDV